jgi:hypothetical protein
MIARRAALSSRAFSTSARRLATESNPALKEETKRNPELYVRHIQISLLVPIAHHALGSSPGAWPPRHPISPSPYPSPTTTVRGHVSITPMP